MTGRVCPVHGEYAADGICRWCEPNDTVQMEYVPPTAHPPADMSVKSATLDELAEIFGPPAELLPSSYALRAIQLSEARLRASNFSYYVLMVRHWHSELVEAQESRLLAQHAALRWERVARRWAAKHGPWTMRDVAQHWQFMFDKLIEFCVRRIAEKASEKEPKP